MNATRIRIALVEQNRRLVDLHRETGISYSRLIRIMNRYSEPTPTEVHQIASAIGVEPGTLSASES